MTLKPLTAVFGLVQDTVRDLSVSSLKTMSVGGSGPEENHQREGWRPVRGSMEATQDHHEADFTQSDVKKSENCVIHTLTISAVMGLCVYMYRANIYTVYTSYTDTQWSITTGKCRWWVLGSSRGKKGEPTVNWSLKPEIQRVQSLKSKNKTWTIYQHESGVVK